MKWILNGPALSVLTKDAIPRRYFENAAPFVLQAQKQAIPIPASWKALPIRSFTSYADMERAFEHGAIDSTVAGILYDNEGWNFTPAVEQAEPARFMQLAAQLVHKHQLLFISAPAVNITKTLAPAQERRYDAYLRLHLAADAARHADVYEIQAQGSERNVPRYSSFVSSAAAQARMANPKIMVLAGISTNPGGLAVTSDHILSAIEATRAYVDGYWFNIPKLSAYCPNCTDFRPDIAIDVLRRLR